MNMKRVPVLYLDMDSTVRKGFDELGRFVNGPEDVEVFPEAVAMMLRWRQQGGRIVAVSNQGGIALGNVSFEKVMAAMRETDRQCKKMFDRITFCPHHPNAESEEDARCWCRKPNIGLLVEAATELGNDYMEEYPLHLALMVGDRDEDQQCAANANIDFQWAHEWRAGAM